MTIEEERDLPYAANNYVRVLIALGRNGDAKKFVKTTNHKIQKTLKDKVAKLDNSNIRLKKVDVIDEIEVDAISSQGSKSDSGVKREQFSSEKILEDELTARIEAGNLYIIELKKDSLSTGSKFHTAAAVTSFLSLL